MDEDYAELDIRFIAQDTASSIQPEELALIETVIPDLILAMLQEDELDTD